MVVMTRWLRSNLARRVFSICTCLQQPEVEDDNFDRTRYETYQRLKLLWVPLSPTVPLAISSSVAFSTSPSPRGLITIVVVIVLFLVLALALFDRLASSIALVAVMSIITLSFFLVLYRFAVRVASLLLV